MKKEKWQQTLQRQGHLLEVEELATRMLMPPFSLFAPRLTSATTCSSTSAWRPPSPQRCACVTTSMACCGSQSRSAVLLEVLAAAPAPGVTSEPWTLSATSRPPKRSADSPAALRTSPWRPSPTAHATCTCTARGRPLTRPSATAAPARASAAWPSSTWWCWILPTPSSVSTSATTTFSWPPPRAFMPSEWPRMPREEGGGPAGGVFQSVGQGCRLSEINLLMSLHALPGSLR